MPVSGQDGSPISSLRAIIAAHGRAVCDDRRALPELLRQTCVDQPEKIDLLIRAQQARVPADLIWYAVAPRADLGTRLMSRLQAQQMLSDEDALWAVTSWMDALDVQVPRPRLRLVQAIPHEAAPPVVPSVTPSSSPATSLTALPTSTKGRETNSQTVKNQTTSKNQTTASRPAALPNWALGAAVAFLLVIGVVIYIATGPPANATHAPSVIYQLPPGYKAPSRTMRPHTMSRLVKTAR